VNYDQDQNIRMVAAVARALGRLDKKVVFLGGAVTGLLITDLAAPQIRSTRDVDVIVEIASKAEYYDLADSLRVLGFREDRDEEAPLCRWRIGDVRVDVMPTFQEVLGFSNDWYLPAMESAVPVRIDEDLDILVVTAPYFLATKIQAFLNRGQGDFFASPDLEDIVAVLDGRREILEEIAGAPEDLRVFLGMTFQDFLNDESFVESLPGHLPSDAAAQQRLPELRRRMEAIASMIR